MTEIAKKFDGYIDEVLDGDDDDGTMVDNVITLRNQVVGRKIVKVERNCVVEMKNYRYFASKNVGGTALVLDNGKRVFLVDTDDCCAYTALTDVIHNLDKIEHVIMGVGTTEEYTKWHIYANLGDVVELDVSWSCGNPFYYGYGFDIFVIDEEGKVAQVHSDGSVEEYENDEDDVIDV